MGLTIPPPVGGLLVAAAVLDFAIGDPFFRWHPVRLIGRSVSTLESWLRGAGADGRIGGCALVALVGSLWSGGVWVLEVAIDAADPIAGAGFHLLCVYFFLALGDLLRHCDKVDLSGNDLAAARQATGKLVGRDTDRMDAAACRRAAVESLAENLVDGFIAPVFWYALAGLPGLVLFKAVSTMDSMVGFRNERYRLFGWCAARSDDLLALVPARLGWLLITLSALVVPKAAGRKACRVAWSQHSMVPGPNPGWSECAMAGAIRRRLAGPIWLAGDLVTETWVGDPADPPAETSADYRLARRVALLAATMAVLLAAIGLLGSGSFGEAQIWPVGDVA